MNWRLARWWFAVNSFGALVALAIMEIDYQSHVRRHEYYQHPPRYALAYLFWLAGLILVGAMDAIGVCWLDSLMRIRNRVLHVTVTVAIALVMAIVLPIAAAAAFGLEMVLAIYILLPTGIGFGAMLGMSGGPT